MIIGRVRNVFLSAIAMSLAACSGGGGGAATPSAAVPAAVATPTAAQSSKTVVGYGTLTIKFPTDLHTSKAAVKRRPEYVNPNMNAKLDIYVDGNLVVPLVMISPGTDGFQTINNVPFTSTNSDIALIEWSDASRSTVLAVGENPYVSISGGQTVAVSVSMFMNATALAISAMPNGSNATNLQPCVQIAANSTFSLFPIDPLNTFTTNPSGAGGFSSIISVTSVSANGGTSRIAQTSTGYLYSADGSNDATDAIISFSNPALNVINNSYSPQLQPLLNGGVLSGKLHSDDYIGGNYVQSFHTTVQTGLCGS